MTELLDRTELIKAGTQPFLRLADVQMNYKPAPDKWSIAEVFQHLNITHGFYIRFIPSKITLAPDITDDHYSSGWLGDWVYEKMMPRLDGSVSKMTTPKKLHPNCSDLDVREIMENFLHQCDALDDILRHAASKDIRRIRIPVSLFPMIKLRLGDALRMVVAHNERHLLQAQRVLKLVPAVD